ncbi:sensor histidine kinase [Flavivirga algicola]|uniref:Histidine kinase n=1 Tax=Flavivirga algicola TaxID=2729136 RepID=A0ABX1RY98_9FLAO|nr:histidine kinase [Flavivirga algicola]NMH88547.1 histidine kinase [Flavivirga algicola]
MKKIILLTLILLCIPVIVLRDSYNKKNNYSNLPKDEKWEYVKERILPKNKLFFNGELRIHKFSGPILYKLYNATSEDSLALENLIEELKPLLPNKEINYFKRYTGMSLGDPFLINEKDSIDINGYNFEHLKKYTIRLFFGSKNPSMRIDSSRSNFIHEKPGFSHITYGKNIESGVAFSENHYSFDETMSIEERQKMLEPFFIRTIACASFFELKSKKIVNSQKSILNDKETVFIDYEFSDLDKFLLQKLYSPTLLEEIKAYMNNAYPWKYTSNYFDKDKTRIIAIWICSILAVTLFSLSFGIFYRKKYKYLYLSYFAPILMGVTCLFNVLYVYGYIIEPALLTDVTIYVVLSIILITIASMAAFCLMLFDKYVIKDSMPFTLQLILKMCFTFLIFIIPVVIVFIAENKYGNWFMRINPFIAASFVFTLIRGVLLYLDYFSDSLIKQKDVELSKLKEVNAQAEVKLLQSQINPHFLYNSLNSIATLASTDTAKTEKMALSLSDLFKYTINRKGKKESSISDEVQMVKNYLEVEQIRFGDRLNFDIEVDRGLERIKIPMFLIQPLIENAVKHGISKIEEEGVIKLIISKSRSGVAITVIDNGPQFPDGLVSGHGLQTVYDLLRLSYGDNALLSWENTPEKRIMITINNIA